MMFDRLVYDRTTYDRTLNDRTMNDRMSNDQTKIREKTLFLYLYINTQINSLYSIKVNYKARIMQLRCE